MIKRRPKPRAVIPCPGVVRCYDIEAGYGDMVIKDLIAKALEEQS